MIISIIVAMDEKGGIGINDRLPWHLPDDLKRFKNLTMGHYLIIGRKTYESIGKTLPGRKIVVLTRGHEIKAGSEIESAENLDQALQLAKSRGESEVFIGGGKEIFQLALPCTDQMYLTIVHTISNADVFFPQCDWTEWVEVERQEHDADVKHAFSFTFKILKRGL